MGCRITEWGAASDPHTYEEEEEEEEDDDDVEDENDDDDDRRNYRRALAARRGPDPPAPQTQGRDSGGAEYFPHRRRGDRIVVFMLSNGRGGAIAAEAEAGSPPRNGRKQSECENTCERGARSKPAREKQYAEGCRILSTQSRGREESSIHIE